MRRMLDPKEAEKGGINLYCHRITLTSTPNTIILNYFYTSDVQFTRSAFITKIGVGHDLPCSGAITSSTSGTKIKYIPTLLYINTNYNISCTAIDLDNNTYKSVNLDNYKFSDDVLPA